MGIRIPVLPPTPIMIAKLRSFSEHYCDFEQPLLAVRAVREQLDWAEIRKATRMSLSRRPFCSSSSAWASSRPSDLELLAHRAWNPPPSSSLAEERTPPLTGAPSLVSAISDGALMHPGCRQVTALLA